MLIISQECCWPSGPRCGPCLDIYGTCVSIVRIYMLQAPLPKDVKYHTIVSSGLQQFNVPYNGSNVLATVTVACHAFISTTSGLVVLFAPLLLVFWNRCKQ